MLPRTVDIKRRGKKQHTTDITTCVLSQYYSSARGKLGRSVGLLSVHGFYFSSQEFLFFRKRTGYVSAWLGYRCPLRLEVELGGRKLGGRLSSQRGKWEGGGHSWDSGSAAVFVAGYRKGRGGGRKEDGGMIEFVVAACRSRVDIRVGWCARSVY